ncbi:MAG: hypothetical protein V1758_07340, partial [Pseudomonadota bacterium]
MKKCIGLILFGLLIVAFSAPVYAVDWKASGYLDTNYFYYKNIFKGNQIYGNHKGTDGNAMGDDRHWNKTGQYFNTRGRLKIDAGIGKDVTGTMFFEMDSARWGEVVGGKDQVGKWTADQAAVEVKNLYLDFGIPYVGIPVPMTARIGIQPLSVRSEMLITTDGPGITLGFKADPVTISPFWFKASQSKDYAANDADVFGTQLIAKVDKLTLGAYGVFYDMRTYPLTSVTYTNVDPSFKARMFWFGGYADGKVGPMDMKADFVMDKGSVKDFGATGHDEVKYQGWVARLKLSFPVEMFEVGAQGLYGTGSDAKKTAGSGLPGSTTPYGNKSFKVGSYVVPPGTEEHVAFGASGSGYFLGGNGITSRGPDNTASSGTSLSRGAIGGVWFAQAFASYKVAPWYKVTAIGSYIGDTTKNGNTVGTARKASGDPRDDKAIGWELGLFNEIQIYKNLSWGTVFAYMIAKDGLDVWSATEGRNLSPQ